MQRTNTIRSFCFAALALGCLSLASAAIGQDTHKDHKDHQAKEPTASQPNDVEKLPSQIFAELQMRLKRLEVALERDHQEAKADQSHTDHAASDPPSSGMKQGMEMKDKGMKMGMGFEPHAWPTGWAGTPRSLARSP